MTAGLATGSVLEVAVVVAMWLVVAAAVWVMVGGGSDGGGVGGEGCGACGSEGRGERSDVCGGGYRRCGSGSIVVRFFAISDPLYASKNSLVTN